MPETPDPNQTPGTQTYMSKSLFSDPVVLVAALTAVLQLPGADELLKEFGVTDRWLHLISFVIAAATVVLRIVSAQRPVSFIAPMQVKPVEVKTLQPTQPADPKPPQPPTP